MVGRGVASRSFGNSFIDENSDEHLGNGLCRGVMTLGATRGSLFWLGGASWRFGILDIVGAGGRFCILGGGPFAIGRALGLDCHVKVISSSILG